MDACMYTKTTRPSRVSSDQSKVRSVQIKNIRRKRKMRFYIFMHP